jgi:hypothetical protein
MQANWRTRKKDFITSVLVLDIKNAYLTIRITLFAKVCIRIKLPTELIKWFISVIGSWPRTPETNQIRLDPEVKTR